ncbi:hypothetical protein [Aquitalea magnusonii]|uniref:hypothetical protein n=1 Tax=Aquitalea magnusonii TaxID=332411 RepID=UPI000B5C609F|nr:hypothetical protein [Aquitalea magnusonii]
MSIEIHRTEKPSTVIGTTTDESQFFIANTRTNGLLHKGYLPSVRDAVQEVIDLEVELKSLLGAEGRDHFVKVRNVFVDDKTNNITLYVDYLHDKNVTPFIGDDEIANRLGNGNVDQHGCGRYVEVKTITAYFASESFNEIADTYYK